MIYLSMMCVGVVSFQWFFWGYSLTFSETASKFIGDLGQFHPFFFCAKFRVHEESSLLLLEHFGMKGVLGQPSVGSTRIPAIVYSVYQLMFAAITYVPLTLLENSNQEP